MAKKLTYSYVKSKFEEEGYTLLSKEYKGNRIKMRCRCPKGHEYVTNWFNWSVNGSRCPICNGGVCLSSEFVENSLSKEGYTLLSKYVNSKSKIIVKCPEGHKFTTSYRGWENGVRCPVCKSNKHKKEKLEFIRVSMEKEGYRLLSNEYVTYESKLKFICNKGHCSSISAHAWDRGCRCAVCAGNSKPTINFIRESFGIEGYTLLSNEYKNSRTKLKYICSNGHEHSITWNNWKQGKRCPKCRQVTIDGVRLEFEKEGYVLLSKKYKNNHTKLDYICPNGHQHSISLCDWRNGHRCAICASTAKPDIKFIRLQFEKEGYKLLSTKYYNNRQELEYICSNNHRCVTTWANWQNGVRCPICHRLSLFGSGNPSWKGGKSFEPYCEVWKDIEFKTDIRERDGNKCLNPYCNSKNPNDLTIHHIDYDKKNCRPYNLITVCRSCNSAANKDRKWHKAWYQAIMHKRYCV
jgi:uncharacterized protein YkuJ